MASYSNRSGQYQAAAAEEELPFTLGPPFADKPSHELLGSTLLAQSRPREGLRAFEAALSRTPGRTDALEGIVEAAQALGDVERAEEARARLRAIGHRDDIEPLGGLRELSATYPRSIP